MPFKPLVHACTIQIDDETMDFWVREPSGREILTVAAKKGKETSPLDNARELFEKYVVHEDGSAISKEEAEGYLDMRLSAMHEMSLTVQDKIGLKKVLEKNA